MPIATEASEEPQAAVDRDQADQAEAADHTHTLAEAQQLAAEVFGARVPS